MRSEAGKSQQEQWRPGDQAARLTTHGERDEHEHEPAEGEQAGGLPDGSIGVQQIGSREEEDRERGDRSEGLGCHSKTRQGGSGRGEREDGPRQEGGDSKPAVSAGDEGDDGLCEVAVLPAHDPAVCVVAPEQRLGRRGHDHRRRRKCRRDSRDKWPFVEGGRKPERQERDRCDQEARAWDVTAEGHVIARVVDQEE